VLNDIASSKQVEKNSKGKQMVRIRKSEQKTNGQAVRLLILNFDSKVGWPHIKFDIKLDIQPDIQPDIEPDIEHDIDQENKTKKPFPATAKVPL